jgi:cytochrome c-type biogenesis protein
MLLGFVAGILSVLSPCVLPLMPAILAGAVAQHRLAPLALAGGVAISFTAIGLFVATIGFSIGVDMVLFRMLAAVFMVAVGTVLLMPRLQTSFATAAGPVANWTEATFGRFSPAGVGGQFGVGLLMGAVWTPCVGPTLGAASLMAARGESLFQVAGTMLAFGIGTAVPLLILGMLSRKLLLRWRGGMAKTASILKMALGFLLITAGALTLTGLDRPLQTALTALAPEWLTAVTMSI